ncbi:hypothetical protein DYB25_013400 [Aphanomyces astaci]|uniref:Uncharacterized protein n=1 Tax=Aphanomyces astaci TaxID=112090 RepID=A0A397BZU2_APHAT|nr:hypothetical protein DYB25_013400 [Aphanomyces astaci]
MEEGLLSTDDDQIPALFALSEVNESTIEAVSALGALEVASPKEASPPTPLDPALLVTTQDTPPASAMPQATNAPDSHDGMNNQQLNDHDDGRLDLLQAANPTKQNHKELQYLKSLAGNRSDTLRSLALAQWELLVLKMQLVTLHARNVENRVTKFRYDKDSHEYSFMHVTKFVYPKSAGPTKSSPFQLKPSVQVSGIRAPQHDGALNDALQDE